MKSPIKLGVKNERSPRSIINGGFMKSPMDWVLKFRAISYWGILKSPIELGIKNESDFIRVDFEISY